MTMISALIKVGDGRSLLEQNLLVPFLLINLVNDVGLVILPGVDVKVLVLFVRVSNLLVIDDRLASDHVP